MPLTVTPSKPTQPGGQPLGRVDDVRSMRFRVRSVLLGVTYAAGGTAIPASAVGMKRIYGVINLSGTGALATPTTAEELGFTPSADFTSVTVRIYTSNGAAPAALAEKNAAAVDARSVLLLFIGY